MELHFDLAFRLTAAGTLPTDHGYRVYSALSHALPELHGNDNWGLHPLKGRLIRPHELMVEPWSRLRIRCPQCMVSPLIQLTGRELQVGPTQVVVGAPTVEPLRPAPALRSRLVMIKPTAEAGQPVPKLTADSFLASANRLAEALGVTAILSIPLVLAGPRVGQPRRRVMRIKEKTIAGYELIAEGLSPEDALALQVKGLGGRRRMGCGVFTPHRG